MASFSEKIEWFKQARRTEPDSAYGNAVSKAAHLRKGGILQLVETSHEIGGRETDASLCAASVSAVQRQTT